MTMMWLCWRPTAASRCHGAPGKLSSTLCTFLILFSCFSSALCNRPICLPCTIPGSRAMKKINSTCDEHSRSPSPSQGRDLWLRMKSWINDRVFWIKLILQERNYWRTNRLLLFSTIRFRLLNKRWCMNVKRHTFIRTVRWVLLSCFSSVLWEKTIC